MWQQITSRIEFYKKAKTLYDVHSPFLFDFITSVLDINKTYYRFDDIESTRKRLLHNTKSIDFQDHGAGSRTLNQTKRKISDIARHSISSPEKCRVLFNIAHYYQCKKILELGTSLGISSSYLAAANSSAFVYSIEGDEQISKIAQQTHRQVGLENIHVICGTFENKLDEVLNLMSTPDLIYLDGHHTLEATLKYFTKTIQHTHNQSIIILDDIYWSSGMQEAWNVISQSEKVTLCIDLYYLGVVFVNPDLQKEVFRYIPAKYKPWRIGLFQ